MKKILWLVPFFGKDAVGGAERASANLIHLIDFAENHVYYTCSPQERTESYLFEGIPCRIGPEESILSYVRKLRPALIIATHELITAAARTGVPYIVYAHDPRAHCLNANTEVCSFHCDGCEFFRSGEDYQNAYSGALAVACCSNHMISLAKQQYPKANYLVKPWKPIQQTDLSTHSSPGRMVGTTAGVPHKGSRLLLSIAERTPQLTYLLAGPCNLTEFPENIRFLGYLPSNEMRSRFYLKIGTYLSLATRGEAYGMTVVEAQAFGIPSLLPYAGGLRESGGSGARFIAKDDLENPDAWARELLFISQDVAAREELIAYGHWHCKSLLEGPYAPYEDLKKTLANLPG